MYLHSYWSRQKSKFSKDLTPHFMRSMNVPQNLYITLFKCDRSNCKLDGEIKQPHCLVVNLENLNIQVAELKTYVLDSAEKATAAHVVELELFKRLLQLGKRVYGAFLQAQGSGDLGASVQTDGHEIQRLEHLHDRPLQTIFGKFQLKRCCYGSREGQKIEFVPLDTRLQLPESQYSYVLQDWDQHLAVENSYGQVNAVIQNILGFTQPVDSLERINYSMAEEVAIFRECKPLPPQSEEGEILVASADGKGIPMRKESSEAPILGHRKRGEKRNKKRMAVVGTIYTIDPSPRTPQEVLDSLFRTSAEPNKKDRPRPQHKQIFASLPQGKGKSFTTSTEIVFNWLELQVRQRDPKSEKHQVMLMDGQPSLWESKKAFFPGDEVIEILDLLHVTPRIWTAAHLFYPEGSPESIGFVRTYLETILSGEVTRAIANLKQLAESRGIKGTKKQSLTTICNYFKKNKNRMKYQDYMKKGYPIASGVVEGACRHLIKDRMERAGMRWTEKGAQAMLDLRSTHLNEDWDRFMRFRIKSQTQKLHPHLKLVKQTEWPLAA
jgi:hypothetical protein